MKRSRFTQEQIIGVLKEHQAGAAAADLCRKHGISEATFYAWRSKYDQPPSSGPGKMLYQPPYPVTAIAQVR